MTKGQYIQDMNRILEILDVRHFSPLELCLVGRKNRRGDVLEAPDEGLYENIVPTLVRIEHVRRLMGVPFFITSGYRDPQYNVGVGGAGSSLHTFFNALDVAPSNGETFQLFNLLDGLPGSEKFGLKEYNTFVHFDTRGILEPGRSGWRG